MNKREGITYLSRIKEIEPLFVLFYPILLLILSRHLHVMIKRRGNYTANDVNEICLEHKNLNDITSQGRKKAYEPKFTSSSELSSDLCVSALQFGKIRPR